MRKGKQLSVGELVMLIFGLICAILVAIGLFFFYSLRTIERHNKELQNQILQDWKLSNALSHNLSLEQLDIFQHVQTQDIEEMKRLDQSLSSIKETEESRWREYATAVDNDTEARLYAKAIQARKEYWEQSESLLALSQVNRDAEARDFALSKQAPAYAEYQKAIANIADWTAKEGGDMAAASTRVIVGTKIVGDALVGLAILITIGTGFALVGVARRLKEDNIVLQTEITERKRAEETLRESEEKFRQMAESITDMFWMTSPDMQQVLYVSPAYESIWGHSPESLYAHPSQWAEAIPPEDRERVVTLFSSLGMGIASASTEFQISRPDGEMRWIYGRGFPVRDAAGKVIRLTGMAADITERKHIEARMFQSQKMETVGKLAGGVAHEFNSILTAIIGQSELLLGDLPPEGPLANKAREIRQAADRAATLTRQLLAYGRKQILQPEILDLNRVLSDMAGTLQHLMGREVDVRIIPAVGLKTIKIDPGQMEQVIVNIAMNAADAMPNGGKLTLESANVTLDEEYVRPFPGLKPGGYVMLAITDTGIGMNEVVKARVFEPFFSTKGVGQGTGLGLATCYGILKQSDGHINVYSEVARGTTFKIYLPQVGKQATIPMARLKSSDLPRGTETILLVEDDPSLLEMSSTLLKRLGYTVLTAANGVEALNLKNQRDIGHIDLLFTDIVMPHMSGKELSDRIRTIYPDTRILFTSAYTESAIVHQGILNEGVALLQKPFTPSALAHKIREILDQ